MPELLQFLFSGLTIGAIYALVAVGFTLIYNASDVINFAQGEFVMLGGMVTFFAAAAGVPIPLAALLAIVVATAVGLLLHRLAIDPARGASAVTLIIITIGASIFLRGIAAIVSTRTSTASRVRRLADPGSSAAPHAAAERDRADRRGRNRSRALAFMTIDADRQGAGRDRSESSGGASRRHQHCRDRRVGVRGLGGDRRVRRHPDDADHADQLRRRHAAGAEGFAAAMLGCMGNPLGAVIGGPHRRPARSLQRRISLVGLQGRDRVPGDPRRPVRHAARSARSRSRRAGLMHNVLRHPYAVVLLLVAIVMALPLLVPSTFHLRIAVLIFIFALAVIGLNC
jgi:branched-chain amino acid transport system permease protein